MSGTPKWTEADVDRMIAIIREHDDMLVAAAAISEAFGQQLGRQALSQLLANRRGIRYGQLLKKRTPPESSPKVAQIVDPVERKAKQDETTRLRREVNGLVEELRVERERNRVLASLEANKAPPKVLRREKKSGVRELTAVVLASDWHVEEPVHAESIQGRNEYNLDIADRRIERFFRSAIWNVEHHRASGRVVIRDMVLWLGGDLMSGYIHPELVESNLLSPTETVAWLLPRLRNGIATLLDVLGLERIVVPCSWGNHSRTTEKPRVSTAAQNNYETLLYLVLAGEFRNDKRVHFEATTSPFQYVDIMGHMLRATHGDTIRYLGGVGGLTIPLMKALPAWDLVRPAEITVLGHFHQLTWLPRAVVNGSLIGYGPYALHIRAQFEEPQQAMFFVDRDRGRCLLTNLWVGEKT